MTPAILTVFKSDVEHVPDIVKSVEALCQDVHREKFFITFIATDGKLGEVIQLLLDHEIGYSLAYKS